MPTPTHPHKNYPIDPSTPGVFAAFFIIGLLISSCGGDANSPRPIPLENQNQADPVSCEDGEQNGTETDIDCGGRDCAPCDQNRACERNTDCLTGICDRGTCVDPQCQGVDCLAGQGCYRGDCWSGCRVQTDCPSAEERCVGGACLPLSCDGVSCDQEAEICYLGGCYEPCETAATCPQADAQCLQGACVAPDCSDGIQSGAETDVDCGGPLCGGCDVGQRCLGDGDCRNETSEWSECEFVEGDICAESGQQTREIVSLECGPGNICAGEVEIETRECQRDTEGIECGDNSPQQWSTCQALPGAEFCVDQGQQSRTILIDRCSSGACIPSEEVETRACSLNRQGASCDDGQACTTGSTCGASGTCEPGAIQEDYCFIDGQCFSGDGFPGAGDSNPANPCETCNPYTYSNTEWSPWGCWGSTSVLGTPDQQIPFNDPDGVNIPIPMEPCPVIEDIRLQVSAGPRGHRFFRIAITPPTGPQIVLHDRTGGDEVGVTGMFPFPDSQFHSVPPNPFLESGEGLLDLLGTSGTGQWLLHVSLFDDSATPADVVRLSVYSLRLWCSQ